jgi:hypothetical protein
MNKLFAVIGLSVLAGCASTLPIQHGKTITFPAGTKVVDNMPITDGEQNTDNSVLESVPNNIPKSVLLSAIVVTQCTLIESAVFTYADGQVMLVDKKHNEAFKDAQAVVKYAESAPWHIRIPASCEDERAI